MKYLMLAYTALTGWDQIDVNSPEFQRVCAFYADLATELTESGELLRTEGLADPALSRTVRNEDGKAVVSDGPFAEAKEVVASFALIDVADHERALELARRVVQNTGDTVEIRPVLSGPPEPSA